MQRVRRLISKQVNILHFLIIKLIGKYAGKIKESMQNINTDSWFKSLRNIVVQKKIDELSLSDDQSVSDCFK